LQCPLHILRLCRFSDGVFGSEHFETRSLADDASVKSIKTIAIGAMVA
jgi:hypothetical protein